jgi:glycosyltransferase involved in cell wall biosynthesis
MASTDDFHSPVQPEPMTQATVPLVSTIIPTRNRPELVVIAVRSVLAQTYQSIEAIVTIDGPDPATVAALAQITDPRLTVISLPVNLGVANARNVGVAAASGTWIAFLDDDDRWLPQKLELQLELADRSTHKLPIIASRFFAQTAKGELIWPRRLPNPDESIGEYLFVRYSPFMGETFIATPTLFVKTELLRQYPFDPQLKIHEDLDWLIKVGTVPGVGLEFVAAPLAIVNAIYTQQRKSLSNDLDWKYSFEWIRSVRQSISPRAYSACLTTTIGSKAAAQGDYRAFLPLLQEAIEFGQPRLLDICLYLVMWSIPQTFRQKLGFLSTSRSLATLISSFKS